MAHTPGPWTVEDPFGSTLAIVPAGKPTHEWVIIAACSYDDPEDDRPRITEPERDANARLIAAAPEMLAALKRARDYITDGRSFLDEASVTEGICAAISKAEAAG